MLLHTNYLQSSVVISTIYYLTGSVGMESYHGLTIPLTLDFSQDAIKVPALRIYMKAGKDQLPNSFTVAKAGVTSSRAVGQRSL